MGLLSRSFSIRTSLTPDQIAETLNKAIKPGSLFALDLPKRNDPQEFRGKVRATTFDFVGRNQFRNSFVPIVHGDVTPIDNGSEINVKLSMHVYMLTFIIVWFLISLMGVAAIISTYLEIEESLGPAWLAGFLPLGGLAIAWVGFSAGIEPATQFLRMTLPPHIPKAQG